MRELTKSIGSFSWAMSLFGMRQMANVLRPSRATEAFDSVTEATEGELGDLLRSTFKLGDRMQRGAVDMTLGMLSAEMFDPRTWTRAMANLTGDAERAMAGVMPSPTPTPRGREAESRRQPEAGAAQRPPAARSGEGSGGRTKQDTGEAGGAGGWGPMGP